MLDTTIFWKRSIHKGGDMVLKLDVIKERLQLLKKALKELQKIKKLSKKDFLESVQTQWSAERGLQIVCEAVFDIGNHILVGKFDETTTNYQSIITLLSKRGVISKGLSNKFERLGGFRNLLVHDYAEIKTEEVYEKLQTRLEDFDLFVREILAWIGK